MLWDGCEEFVSPIEPRRVSAQEPLHPRHKVGPWGFHHQMKVIGHQTPGMHLPVRLATALLEGGQKQLPIRVIPHNRLSPIPAIHHVIDRSRIFDSQLARHAPMLPTANSVSMFRTDPFRAFDPFRALSFQIDFAYAFSRRIQVIRFMTHHYDTDPARDYCG